MPTKGAPRVRGSLSAVSARHRSGACAGRWTHRRPLLSPGGKVLDAARSSRSGGCGGAVRQTPQTHRRLVTWAPDLRSCPRSYTVSPTCRMGKEWEYGRLCAAEGACTCPPMAADASLGDLVERRRAPWLQSPPSGCGNRSVLARDRRNGFLADGARAALSIAGKPFQVQGTRWPVPSGHLVARASRL
jgi:hypothetical protein